MKAIAWFWVFCMYGLNMSVAQALTPQQVRDIVTGETDARIESLQKVLAQADAQTTVFLQALADDAVVIAEEQVVIVREGKGFDPATGKDMPVPAGAEGVVSNNRMRGEIDSALAALQLLSTDEAIRMKAAQALVSEPDPSKKPLLEKAIAAEKNSAISQLLLLAQAAIDINSTDVKERLAAAKALGNSKTPNTQLLLNQQMMQETDPAVRAQMGASLAEIKSALAWGERLGALFTGLSLGSILLLVALGLAITYGLMGVINMAHGELMMVGAYATYVVQVFFRQHMGSAFDYYLVAALPMAFLSAALVGALLERTVLRHLYGRPLETLLATWGISLILMQTVRTVFGAQNVAVENPSWMSGGIQVLVNLSLPWNRLLIVVFAFLVLGGVALLISQTRLGLFVRGVTQNRAMASCMGVNTARIDTYAFALGSGIAGLAGCALSQIGNVGPD